MAIGFSIASFVVPSVVTHFSTGCIPQVDFWLQSPLYNKTNAVGYALCTSPSKLLTCAHYLQRSVVLCCHSQVFSWKAFLRFMLPSAYAVFKLSLLGASCGVQHPIAYRGTSL